MVQVLPLHHQLLLVIGFDHAYQSFVLDHAWLDEILQITLSHIGNILSEFGTILSLGSFPVLLFCCFFLWELIHINMIIGKVDVLEGWRLHLSKLAVTNDWVLLEGRLLILGLLIVIHFGELIEASLNIRIWRLIRKWSIHAHFYMY